MEDFREVFGQRVRALRRGANLTLENLAERSGIHWTYLSDVERGRQSPTLDVVNRIARGLRVSVADLFSPFTAAYRSQFRKARQDSRAVSPAARGRREHQS